MRSRKTKHSTKKCVHTEWYGKRWCDDRREILGNRFWIFVSATNALEGDKNFRFDRSNGWRALCPFSFLTSLGFMRPDKILSPGGRLEAESACKRDKDAPEYNKVCSFHIHFLFKEFVPLLPLFCCIHSIRNLFVGVPVLRSWLLCEYACAVAAATAWSTSFEIHNNNNNKIPLTFELKRDTKLRWAHDNALTSHTVNWE